jgi:hypothetical protein
MKALLLAILFAVHVAVFLRLYLKHQERMNYVLLVIGFLHLSAYYAYRTWVFYSHWGSDLDWMSYLRWSGVALCLLGSPFVPFLYNKARARLSRQDRQ